MEKNPLEKTHSPNNRPKRNFRYGNKKKTGENSGKENVQPNSQDPSKKKNSNASSPTSKKTYHQRPYPRKTYSPSNDKPDIPSTPLVVFAQCEICSTGISNESYALKIEEGKYIHFECAIRNLKAIAQKAYSSYGKRLRYTYMGSSTFAIYLEQGGNSYSWKILQKINLEKLLPQQKNEASVQQ